MDVDLVERAIVMEDFYEGWIKRTRVVGGWPDRAAVDGRLLLCSAFISRDDRTDDVLFKVSNGQARYRVVRKEDYSGIHHLALLTCCLDA